MAGYKVEDVYGTKMKQDIFTTDKSLTIAFFADATGGKE
jgi:hypothetical protein